MVLLAGILFPYVAPFVAAVVLALLVDPLVEKLIRRFRLPRPTAVSVVLAGALLGCGVAVSLAAVQLGHEVSQLLKGAPEVGERIQFWGGYVAEWVAGALAALPHPVDDMLRRILDGLAGAVLAQAQGVLALARSVPQFLFVLMVAGLTAYFLLRDKEVFARALLTPLPPGLQKAVRLVLRRLSAGVLGFIRAQLAVMALTASLSVLAFSGLQTPYPWLLGLLAGLLELVPFVGPGGVYVPAIFWHLLAGGTGPALGALLAWGAVLVVRQGMEPRLVGSQMGLHPATAITAVYLGVKTAGFPGFVLGPLAAVFLKAAFSAWPAVARGEPRDIILSERGGIPTGTRNCRFRIDGLHRHPNP